MVDPKTRLESELLVESGIWSVACEVLGLLLSDFEMVMLE
jgi:hypothetical protein